MPLNFVRYAPEIEIVDCSATSRRHTRKGSTPSRAATVR